MEIQILLLKSPIVALGAAKLLEAARNLPLAAIIHTKEVQHRETVELWDFGMSHDIHIVYSV